MDYEITENSPSGSCHLRLLEGLRNEFDFTVFSSAFDNPDPSRISWRRVPALRRPMVARYGSFFATSSLLVRESHFDLVQAVEGYTRACDISYVHFCHRCYLRRSENEYLPRTLRARLRQWDHRARAIHERRAVERPELLVVPAENLASELVQEYGVEPERISVVANPVDLDRFERPNDPSRNSWRRDVGARSTDLVVVFVALGHFERKGLPVLLEGLRDAANDRIGLVVVGGTPDLVEDYRKRADQLGLRARVSFVGMQRDVRPWLWSADVFASLSSYEVFALAPLQAAVAGLPLLVTRAPGVAGFFREGEHGFSVERESASVAAALDRLADLSPEQRRTMGAAARRAAEPFGTDRFVADWRAIYQGALERRAAGD